MADTTPGVLTLPDIAYERATIRTSIEGRSIALDGWVKGPGCPASVVAEYGRKRRSLIDALNRGADPDAAYAEFMTDALRVIFPGLTYEDADLLAGEASRADSILVHYRWREPDAKQSDDADPEAPGEDGSQTTRPSSPISVLPTEASAPTAAAG